MRILVLTCLILLPLLTFAQTEPPTHIVRAGETLFSISRQYDVSVQQLREWNNLPDNTIRVGSRLYLGERPSRDTDGAEPDTIRHVVEPGQTLFRLSRMYDVNVDDLRSWNDLDSDALSIGQELTIYLSHTDAPPGADDPQIAEIGAPEQTESPDTEIWDQPAEVAESPAYYEVRAGDTMTRIASRYNMSVEELMEINDLDDTRLIVGQELRVRSRTAPPPSVAAEWDLESTPQGKFVTYTLNEEDSLDQLLQYHQMDRREFRALNPGLSLSDVRPGDEVTLLLAATSSQSNPYKITNSGDEESRIEVSRYPGDRRGTRTTSGDLYNPSALTAAHPGLSLGTVVYVKNPDNGRGIFVLINDRTSDNRLLLSERAFQALEYDSATRLVAEIHEN